LLFVARPAAPALGQKAPCLPEVDMNLWSDLIAFHLSAYGLFDGETSEHAQIRGFIERDKKFGLVSNVYGFWPDDGSESFEEMVKSSRAKELEETLEIATKTTIFPLFANAQTLERLIKELSKFSYADGTGEADKLEQLRVLFNLIKQKTQE
jgi:hypothetical protein